MNQLINDCTFNKVDPKEIPMFDNRIYFSKIKK